MIISIQLEEMDPIMQDQDWNELNPRNTILFLGSGFSMEAKNKNNEKFLDTKGLSSRLETVLGYNNSAQLSLQDVSDDFLPDRTGLLFETLHPLLTAKSINSDQEEMSKQAWRRVYTTNFDDVFELGQIKTGISTETLSFDDPVRTSRDKVQVVHLHGYIHKCAEDNIDEQLVLTKSSYVRQLSRPRPWFE
jgi:SIR2-like domain